MPSLECALYCIQHLGSKILYSDCETFSQCNVGRCEVGLENVSGTCEFSLVGEVLRLFLCWHGKGKFLWNDNCIKEHIKHYHGVFQLLSEHAQNSNHQMKCFFFIGTCNNPGNNATCAIS